MAGQKKGIKFKELSPKTGQYLLEKCGGDVNRLEKGYLRALERLDNLSDKKSIDTYNGAAFTFDAEFYETNRKFIQTHEIESIVCISHHKSCVKETLELAKVLLDRYGGWIGNGNDGFYLFLMQQIFHHFPIRDFRI